MPETVQASRKQRQLGANGPEISTLGLGAWAIGGPSRFGWGEVDDEVSIKTIRDAVESGINWVDTAAFYGKGHSEEIVGNALRPWLGTGEVYVFTKCGLRWYSDDPNEPPENNLRPESMRYECEQSLRRLGVERIDLYQFHWPDTIGTPVEESWQTMADLIDEGKVRWGGVSNFDVDLLERCESIRHVDSDQPKLNMLDRGALDRVVPWCRTNGVGVLAYSPLASGLLGGTWNELRKKTLSDDDWRKHAPEFQEPQLTRSLEIVNQLHEIANSAGTTIPVLAIAWVLAQPGVTGAIVGARNSEQMAGWLPAANFTMDEETGAAVARVLG
ncbi:MAG: aldo/keto reductase [Actinomycetota bacterium]|nr:aldo/keto reductase [Actinomycetota bacterium]